MSDFNEKDRSVDTQPAGQQTTAPADTAAPTGASAPPPAPPWTGQARPVQPPYGGYQQPYDPYHQQAQGYNPYQYNNSGAGWQQQAKQGRYEWNFQDYDKLAGNGKPKKGKKNKGLMIFTIAMLCVLTLSLVSLAAVGVYNSLDEGPAAPGLFESSTAETRDEVREEVSQGDAAQVELSSKPQVQEPVSADGKLTIPQVAERLLPSVVSVENYQQGYFYEPVGLGSGIIMNTDGYIITNQHVVEGADALKVTLNNGEPHEARLIGADARTDLAVIKIEADGLVPADFGNSEELRVGETVIAIGNPASMELAGSVTLGIVSALDRQITIGTYSMNFIQTDAAINPGNSGGALVNEFGQVIGINSAKIQQVGFEGIGFAIPINEAKPIIDDIIANGRVTGRVMLGISAQPVDEVDARRYDVPLGLRIVTIEPTSDLGRKGVQTMDIITHIEGVRIYTLDDLRQELDRHKVGDTVRLTLYRQSSITKGTSYDVSITLIEDMG